MAQRLKALELQGYKTFASRTAFAFPGEITAVVGPNGSGKSNIADAIRWVLGEQSYSLLRGRKTEDMIFAGSEQRPRAGMAQATITFDNADGWLPIDYNEVSISRRAYRDGQNDYLLNGHRVRLKEIMELLAQSGLAERTYTIIGQGLVDAALSLKPEERRKFFEEAAGIGLYRSRRDEALSRLETTRRNLERVQDILAELEPRLSSLERQARRVQEYERVKADLQLLLREWYGFHWYRTQEDITHAQEVMKVQESRLEQARQRLAGMDEELGKIQSQIATVREELNGLHSQSSGLHQEREQLSRTLAVLEERKRGLVVQRQNLESNVLRLEEESQGLQNREQELKEQQAALQQELDEAETQLDQANQALADRKKTRETIEADYRRLQAEALSLEESRIRVEAQLKELTARRQATHSTLDRITQAFAQETENLTSAERQKKNAEAASQRAIDERNKIQAELDAARKQADELDDEIRLLVNQQSALQAQESRLKAQLDVIEQAEQSFGGLNQGALALLEAHKAGRLQGNLRSFSHLLIVPQEYEVAIAAAMGECLDAVVLPEQHELDAALSYLEEGEQGRAVMLVPSDHGGDAPLKLPKGEGVIGLADQLVTAPEEARQLVAAILGNVIVVKDRGRAQRLLPSLPKDLKVVTLKGEVFSRGGMVIAGRDKRSRLLARPREKVEINALLVEAGENLRVLEEKLGASRQKRDGVTQRLADLGKQLQEKSTQVSAANQELQKATLSLEQARQRLKWQQEQLSQNELALSNLGEDLLTAENSLDHFKSLLGTNESKLKELTQALAGLPLEELTSQAEYWRTALAVTQRAVRELDVRRKDLMTRLEQAARQLLEARQKLSDNQTALADLELEKNALHQREGELKLKLDELIKKIQPNEARLDKLLRQMDEFQKNQLGTQQAVSLAERYFNQAQLDYSRHRDTMESLQRRINEDFGLVALEYNPEVTGQTPLPFDESLVQQFPVVKQVRPEIEESIARQRSILRRMGAVNFEAQKEYQEVSERHAFLKEQLADLTKADADLREIIAELDTLMKQEFMKTFDAVAMEFRSMFTRLFGGGSAKLVLDDAENLNETGVDIEARLPGRREQGLSLLSGGERSLTAVALIFSLLKTSPTPFCVLDEVDAMLDEANVGRFRDLLRELSLNTQFVIITHNRNTVQAADVIYGVTMGRDSTSQVISLNLDELSDELVV